MKITDEMVEKMCDFILARHQVILDQFILRDALETVAPMMEQEANGAGKKILIDQNEELKRELRMVHNELNNPDRVGYVRAHVWRCLHRMAAEIGELAQLAAEGPSYQTYHKVVPARMDYLLVTLAADGWRLHTALATSTNSFAEFTLIFEKEPQ